MFTMDDWLGLVLLMVCIVSAIALIVMFVVGCVGVVRWRLSNRVDAFGTQRAGRSAPPFRSVPSEADFAAARAMSDAIGRLPYKLVRNDNWPHLKPGYYEGSPGDLADIVAERMVNYGGPRLDPRTRDEQVATIQALADGRLGMHIPTLGIPCRLCGAAMSLDTMHHCVPLDSIIRDLREAILLEHLEVRTTTRFNNILKRLEAYREP